MRVASRIIGVLMIVAALGFFAVLLFLFIAGRDRGAPTTWAAYGFYLILTIASLLGARSYLRLRSGRPGEGTTASGTTQFIIRHRAQLKMLAQIGLMLSLARAATVFVHSDWLGRYSNLWLTAGVFVLFYLARKIANPNVAGNSDWGRVPEWIRRALPPLSPLVWWAGVIMLSGRIWFPAIFTPGNKIYAVIDRVVAGLLLSFMYAIEALYFKYGELRSGPVPAA